MVFCLQRGADCLHMVQLMPLHPETPSSLAPFKSRLVLPFWCRFTQVVLEKRPLNGCSSSSSILLLIVQHAVMCLFRYLELLSPVAWICSTVLLNVHLSMWGIFYCIMKCTYAHGFFVQSRSLIITVIVMNFLSNLIPSVLSHCWLGGRKGIWPARN